MDAFRFKKLWWITGFLGLILIAIGSLTPAQAQSPLIPHFDKVLHVTGYGLASFYFQQLLHNKKVITIFCFIFFYSALIELLQDQLPTRQMSVADLIANFAGCALGTYLSIKVFSTFLFKLDQIFSGRMNR